MEPSMLQAIVDKVFMQLQQSQPVPIAVSARHVHLSPEHLEELFGRGYNLTKKADLSQPGQFAANETVIIVGPKGSIERVRILGPCRGKTQVEVSRTDAMKLGINAPLRESGNLDGAASITIIGPKKSIHVEGCIVAKCHIHMNPQDASYYHVKHGETVQIQIRGERPITFDEVLIRVSDRYNLEMHVDTDEANTALLSAKDIGVLRKIQAEGV